MKKKLKIFLLISFIFVILFSTIYSDYKKASAAALPVAIWGLTESVLALFGAFGLGVGVNQAYKDSTIADKDAIDLLQDFRGFLAKGSNLALPYTLIESQLNSLERALQESQLKGYLTLIRGGVTGQESPTPDGPKKNKFEKSLIDSIKQYVVARHIIDKGNMLKNEDPTDTLYNGDFYFDKLKSCLTAEGFSFCTGNNARFETYYRDLFNNHVIPSELYYYGYRIQPARYSYEGKFIEFFFPRVLNTTHDFNTKNMTMVRLFVNSSEPFVHEYNLSLNFETSKGTGEFFVKDLIKSTNWKLLQDYKDGKYVNDLGTTGRITVDGGVGAIIDRDGNLDNYEIITPGTKVNPDGSLEGDITIPVPQRLPSNQPLPAGQTEPALEYGTQVDYGLGTDINGNVAINTIPTPGAAPVAGEWTAEEQSANEKSKSLVNLFPFCIPFDLIDALKLLKAKPEVPHWEFDWVIPSVDFKYHFVIDLSMFNTLFYIFNKMFLLSFIVGLILLTRNIIRG